MALRAPAAVRARDVMFNWPDPQAKKPPLLAVFLRVTVRLLEGADPVAETEGYSVASAAKFLIHFQSLKHLTSQRIKLH